MKFSKLHGAGNDFVIINRFENEIEDLSIFAKEMCDRHFGIGADGLMAVYRSSVADVKMVYYNSDGSIAEMCGNGIRCFSKFVYDNKIVEKDFFNIETKAGIKKVFLDIEEGQVKIVKVNMGSWIYDPKKIPVKTDKEAFIAQKINIDGQEIELSCVLMGVPHAIIYVDEINENDTIRLGSKIEKLDIFTNNINVNFVKIIDKSSIKVDTWERGAGKTLACGTGCCASVIISNKLDLVDKEVEVWVEGGVLKISLNDDNEVIMKGEASLICSGEYHI